MTSSVAHSILTHDPVVWLTTISGMTATWIVAYYTAIRPARKAHKEHEAHKADELKAEKYRMEARWVILDGWAGVPGLYAGGDPLAIRLQTMESEIAELKARHG
jgi:hypothetical protein